MNDMFPILAVETSGELCSAAVMLDEKNFVELNYLQKHIHSEKLIDMIDTVLKTANIKLQECKAVAVSMGPGSFTGLRIGLSAVKGIAFGKNLPIIPISTFEAYAYHIAQYIPITTKFIIIRSASIDELYCAKFIKEENKVRVISPLRLVEKNNLEKIIEEGELLYGNVSSKNELKDAVGLTASAVGKWAYLFGNDLLTFNYDYLEPNYFKKFIVKVKS